MGNDYILSPTLPPERRVTWFLSRNCVQHHMEGLIWHVFIAWVQPGVPSESDFYVSEQSRQGITYSSHPADSFKLSVYLESSQMLLMADGTPLRIFPQSCTIWWQTTVGNQSHNLTSAFDRLGRTTLDSMRRVCWTTAQHSFSIWRDRWCPCAYDIPCAASSWEGGTRSKIGRYVERFCW